MNRRRGQIRATRSSKEYSTVHYYCTGGAGAAAAAEAAAYSAETALVWRAGDGTGHGAVPARGSGAPGIVGCPVCGLVKPLGYKRRRAIRDAALTEVDISALPF